MSKRIKQTAVKAVDRETASLLVTTIAQAQANLRELTAVKDARVLEIEARFAKSEGKITAAIKEMTGHVHDWARANPQEFEKRKSVKFPAGVVGFRTGTPKLKTLAKWTWDAALAAVEQLRVWPGYVRTVKEVNKEQIIADHSAKKITDAELAKLGLTVVQTETFYVEPKVSEDEPRQVEEEKEAA